MNILITEGMGHIGKNLINKLSNTKIIIINNFKNNRENILVRNLK